MNLLALEMQGLVDLAMAWIQFTALCVIIYNSFNRISNRVFYGSVWVIVGIISIAKFLIYPGEASIALIAFVVFIYGIWVGYGIVVWTKRV